MKKKITGIVTDMFLYFVSALLISFIFRRFGLIEGSIYLYALVLTIGWTAGRLAIDFFKKRKNKI